MRRRRGCVGENAALAGTCAKRHRGLRMVGRRIGGSFHPTIRQSADPPDTMADQFRVAPCLISGPNASNRILELGPWTGIAIAGLQSGSRKTKCTRP